MLTVQVIFFLISIHGYYCHQNCAKVGSLMNGTVKVLVFTKFNWNIETYRYDSTKSSNKMLTYFIGSNVDLKSQDNHITNAIKIMFYCQQIGEFDEKRSIQLTPTERTVHCRQNNIEIWKNVQVNFDTFNDIALYYRCNGVSNKSILLLLLRKDYQLNKDINEKIKTAMIIDYPDIQEKFDVNGFYEINDYNECQKYLDSISCDHFVTLNLKLNDFGYSASLILLFILILWLLGFGICCYEILKSQNEM